MVRLRISQIALQRRKCGINEDFPSEGIDADRGANGLIKCENKEQSLGKTRIRVHFKIKAPKHFEWGTFGMAGSEDLRGSHLSEKPGRSPGTLPTLKKIELTKTETETG